MHLALTDSLIVSNIIAFVAFDAELNVVSNHDQSVVEDTSDQSDDTTYGEEKAR